LYHLDLGWDFVQSIEALEKANYVIKDLDQRSCETLLEALGMWRTRNDVDIDVAVDVLDKGDDEWDAARAINALCSIEDALIGGSSEESSE
jgi:hypothetical protein